MDFDPARLRKGEMIVGASAVVLLASMFALKWYGVTGSLAHSVTRLGGPTSVTGWNGLSQLRWLLLVTGLAGLALVFFQATRRAPAVPVSFSVIASVLGLLSTLALIYRVLINQPGSNDLVDQKAGAFVGLIAALVLTWGGYVSMREEGTLERDGPGEIETVRLGDAT
ncbi:MAG: hypothetical protein ACJ76X_02890 [Solirubrobacteraceae bacterium]|jgi:hypothetical protein